jgi:hypothetical protein
MWPFKKKITPRANPPQPAETQWIAPAEISFSQCDVTETFGDDQRLGPDDWISTTPINQMIPAGSAPGLPALDATDDEVYAVAERMSQFREQVQVPNDGVYCPICHLANTQLENLRTPCPKCQRPLLKFGWE